MSSLTSNIEGLTDSQLTFFQENGFVGPLPLYSPQDAVARWNRAKIEMVLSKNKPHHSTIINYDRHLDCNTLSEHVTRPEIVSKLRSLMGNDILCWKTNIFPKYPGDAGTGWHQVETFAAAQENDVPVPALKYTEKSRHVTSELTVWTAFSPVRREHGCMRFLPGTHKKWYYDETKSMKRKVEQKRDDFFGYDYSELKIDEDWDPDAQEVVEMEMEAGQFVIFLAKCVHGSLPNITKDQTRMGFASRYVSPSVKVYDGISSLNEFGEKINLDYHGCVLVAGEDRYNYNKIHQVNLNGYPFQKAF
jgi:non-heme Fe2+,alpha-ketoglutarate-dependent halogenase